MTAGKTTFLIALVFAQLMTGCGLKQNDKPQVALPRPVSVFRLAESDPHLMNRLTGLVGSWKTEDLGFEVPGRVQWVIEAETDVEGERVKIIEEVGKDGVARKKRDLLREGQILAGIDDTRYQLAAKSAAAQIATAREERNAAAIEVASVIPAQAQAATANLNFRKSELERHQKLRVSRTITQSEYERVFADYQVSVAALKQIAATQLAKQAEVASLQAKIDELTESLAQAERDIKDCQIYAPFRAQVARVHVIPGGVVKAGQPVVTVQLMDPIKIDLEVSSATSRGLNYRDHVKVFISPDAATNSSPSNDGEPDPYAFVYMIDPVADPATRTFTVTLLMRNQKAQTPVPDGLGDQVVRARDVWQLNERPDSNDEGYFTEKSAIHDDDGEPYVWKITNWKQIVAKETALLHVTKVKVIPGDLEVDWLGLWTFREIAIASGEVFDVKTDFIAGGLDTDEPLRGDRILLDRVKWRLRPGDLVGVDLSGGHSPLGFYIPMDAIHASAGKYYVFEAADGRARRIEVSTSEGPTIASRRIESVVGEPLTVGMQLVASGVHYLTDGEPIAITEEAPR